MMMPREAGQLTLSVIVLGHNAAATIAAVLERLRLVPLAIETIAVDDRSSEGTGALLDRLAQQGAVDRVVHMPARSGPGAAVRAGVAAATGRIILAQDACLAHDPMELPALLEPIRLGKADAVYGSRFQRGTARRVAGFWRSLARRLLTLLSNMFTDLNLTDVTSGYKLVRADLLRSLPLVSERLGIEFELTARLAQAGARVWELPVPDTGGPFADGTTSTWRDRITAPVLIARYSLFPPGGDWRKR